MKKLVGIVCLTILILVLFTYFVNVAALYYYAMDRKNSALYSNYDIPVNVYVIVSQGRLVFQKLSVIGKGASVISTLSCGQDSCRVKSGPFYSEFPQLSRVYTKQFYDDYLQEHPTTLFGKSKDAESFETDQRMSR